MKTFIHFNRFLRLAAFVCALLCSACSSDASTEGPISGVHTLKSGNSFTYHVYATGLDSAVVPGSDTTLSAIVNRTSLSIEGKSNVMEILQGPDTTYFAEANDSSFAVLQNPIGITSGVAIPGIWVSFNPAFNGKTLYDSTLDGMISGMPAKIHTSIVTNYLGKDAVTIGGAVLSIYKFSKVVTVVVTIMGQDYTTIVTVNNNYAPSLGYLTLHNTKTSSNSDRSPVPNGINYSLLQSYSL